MVVIEECSKNVQNVHTLLVWKTYREHTNFAARGIALPSTMFKCYCRAEISRSPTSDYELDACLNLSPTLVSPPCTSPTATAHEDSPSCLSQDAGAAAQELLLSNDVE